MAPRGPKSDKLWADAVRLAIHREEQEPDGQIRKRLNIIADNLCRMAMAGDMQAIKEVGDRLDGRPAQAIIGAGEDGEHEVIHKIVREIVRPPSSGS